MANDSNPAPATPCRAYIPHSRQTGPDTWVPEREERIVWAIFEGLALTSRTHGSDLCVISITSLVFEP